MFKKIFGTIIIIIIIIILFILLNKKNDNEIVLITHGGVPYNWEYTIEDTSIVKFKEMMSVSKSIGTVGGEVEEHYIFEGLKEGKAKINFIYKNITDNSIEKTINYEVIVDKNMKITIYKISET